MKWWQAFLQQAQKDLDAAKVLQKANLGSQCLWFAQQAVEKSLKAYVFRTKKIKPISLKTHSLKKILEKFSKQEKWKLLRVAGNRIEETFNNLFPDDDPNLEKPNVRYPFEEKGTIKCPYLYEKYNGRNLATPMRLANNIVMYIRKQPS